MTVIYYIGIWFIFHLMCTCIWLYSTRSSYSKKISFHFKRDLEEYCWIKIKWWKKTLLCSFLEGFMLKSCFVFYRNTKICDLCTGLACATKSLWNKFVSERIFYPYKYLYYFLIKYLFLQILFYIKYKSDIYIRLLLFLLY